MGKTADRYSEGASRGHQKVSSPESLVAKQLTDSKECWIMGKTADRYSEGASAGHQKVSSPESLVAKQF